MFGIMKEFTCVYCGAKNKQQLAMAHYYEINGDKENLYTEMFCGICGETTYVSKDKGIKVEDIKEIEKDITIFH